MRPFVLPGFLHDLVRGPMHAHIGDASHPGAWLAAQILHRVGVAPKEKTTADITDPRFHSYILLGRHSRGRNPQ